MSSNCVTKDRKKEWGIRDFNILEYRNLQYEAHHTLGAVELGHVELGQDWFDWSVYLKNGSYWFAFQRFPIITYQIRFEWIRPWQCFFIKLLIGHIYLLLNKAFRWFLDLSASPERSHKVARFHVLVKKTARKFCSKRINCIKCRGKSRKFQIEPWGTAESTQPELQKNPIWPDGKFPTRRKIVLRPSKMKITKISGFNP